MVLETGDDVGGGKPQAFAPFVVLSESWAVLFFFNFNALSAIFARDEGVTTTFATSVFLNAVSFGHHFQKFLISSTTPVGNVRTESAGLERFGEYTPTTADQRGWRQIADLTVAGACFAFSID